MDPITGLLIASFVLSATGTYMNMEQAKQQADMQKDNLELQQQSLAAQREADELDKEIAEAKARENARKAQSQIAMKQALSGATGSIYDAMSTSTETQYDSGMEYIAQKYDIKSQMSYLSSQQLSNQASTIQSTWDMELGAALGIGASGFGSAASYGMYQGRNNTISGNADISLFNSSGGSGTGSSFNKPNSTPTDLLS